MAHQLLNKELKNKLESHKKWLEEQINSQSYEAGDLECSGNPEDALDEIANNSIQFSPYKPIYPSDEHRQQYKKAEEAIYDFTNGKKTATSNGEAITCPNNKNAKDSNQFSPIGKAGKESSNLSTPKRDIYSPRSQRSQGKASETETSSPEKIDYYGKLSGNKQWDELLLRNQKHLESKKLLMELKKPDDDIDEECTFKPQILSTPKSSKLLPFDERVKLWSSQKELKIEKSKQKDADKDLEDCTFQPKINTHHWNLNPDATALSSRGTDQFLRRQLIARQQKEEKEIILNNPLTKSTPTHKSGQQFTIPKSPFTGKVDPEKKQINSLKKPMSPTYLSGYSTARARLSEKSAKVSATKAREEKYVEQLQKIMDQQSPEYVHISDVSYGKALNLLHKQLNKIEINYD